MRLGVRLQPTPLPEYSAAQALGTQQRRFSPGRTARDARLGAAAAASTVTLAAHRSRSPSGVRGCTPAPALRRPPA